MLVLRIKLGAGVKIESCSARSLIRNNTAISKDRFGGGECKIFHSAGFSNKCQTINIFSKLAFLNPLSD
jgi:hypothetical protein